MLVLFTGQESKIYKDSIYSDRKQREAETLQTFVWLDHSVSLEIDIKDYLFQL